MGSPAPGFSLSGFPSGCSSATLFVSDHAALLRAGRLQEADIEHIAEEIEDIDLLR